jgi:hypothetical protein
LSIDAGSSAVLVVVVVAFRTAVLSVVLTVVV